MNFIPDDLLKTGDILFIYNRPDVLDQTYLLTSCTENKYVLLYPDRTRRMPAWCTDMVYEAYRDGCLVWLLIDSIVIDRMLKERGA